MVFEVREVPMDDVPREAEWRELTGNSEEFSGGSSWVGSDLVAYPLDFARARKISIEIDIDEMRRDGNLTLNLRGHGSSPCAPTIFPDGLVELPAR